MFSSITVAVVELPGVAVAKATVETRVPVVSVKTPCGATATPFSGAVWTPLPVLALSLT
jgi:hypothetical protein